MFLAQHLGDVWLGQACSWLEFSPSAPAPVAISRGLDPKPPAVVSNKFNDQPAYDLWAVRNFADSLFTALLNAATLSC